MKLNSFDFKQCDIQGRFFEMSRRKNLSSASFIKKFMNSDLAVNLDKEYNQMQWMGEEYLMEELLATEEIEMGGEIYDNECLFWIGYLYRYWHFYTGESSKKILREAPVKLMATSYLMFHTMDPEMAIDNLKEISSQKK